LPTHFSIVFENCGFIIGLWAKPTLVGIGKYENRRRFDQSDIGTSALKEDLRKAYKNTQ
jgi:hypothetical protein